MHPAVAAARGQLRESLVDVEAGSLVLVGLSGGADSLALCASLSFVAPGAGLRWGAVVVDHGLQPGSGTVAAAAAQQAADLGAEHAEVVRVDVDGRGGPEAAARTARRAALAAAAQRLGAVAVLLAHTRDDQAETVLLGLARGSGARSLSGMRPVQGLWRRPWLRLEASVPRAVCVELGLDFWDDPHNSDRSFTRVRVRRHVLPELESHLGPGISAALARTADLLRDDADLLDALAAELAERVTAADGSLDAAALADAHRALRSRVLRGAAVAAGCPGNGLGAEHVCAVDRLLTAWHGQQGVDLPGGVVATRSDGALRLAHRPG